MRLHEPREPLAPEDAPARRRDAPGGPLVLRLQQGAGNAAVTRWLQRADWLTEQRTKAAGMDAEDVDVERRRLGPIGHVGADATRDAQGVHPVGPTGGQTDALEAMLANRQQLGEQRYPGAGPIERAGAQATREAQGTHPIGPRGSEVANVKSALEAKHGLEPSAPDPIRRPGAAATAEARALEPTRPSGAQLASLEATLANKQGIGPQQYPGPGPIVRAGAEATREAQAMHPIGPGGREVANVKSALESKHGLTPSAPDPIRRPGAADVAEAQELHAEALPDSEKSGLEDALRLRHRRRRAPLGPVKTIREQHAAKARREEKTESSATRRREQDEAKETAEQEKGDRGERIDKRNANRPEGPFDEARQERLTAHETARLNAEEEHLRAEQARIAAHAVRELASATAAEIAAAPLQVREALNASITARVEAARLADEDDHATRKTELDAAIREFKAKNEGIQFAAKENARARLGKLATEHLAEALQYPAPELALLHADVTALTAGNDWLAAVSKLEELDRQFAPVKAALGTIESVRRRAVYTRARVTAGEAADPGSLGAVEARLAARHTTAMTGLPAFATTLENEMLAAETPVAHELLADAHSLSDPRLTAMLDQTLTNGILTLKRVTSTYPTQSDGTSGYGAEIELSATQAIVIHAHVKLDGRIMKTHWKRSVDKRELGTSHALGPAAVAAIRAFLPKIQEKAKRDGRFRQR